MIYATAKALLRDARNGDETAPLALCNEIELLLGKPDGGTDYAMQFAAALRSVDPGPAVMARLDELAVEIGKRPAAERAAFEARQAAIAAYIPPPEPPTPVLTEREKFRAREAERRAAALATEQLEMQRRHAEAMELEARTRAVADDPDAAFLLADAAEAWAAAGETAKALDLADEAERNASQIAKAEIGAVKAKLESEAVVTRKGAGEGDGDLRRKGRK